MKRIDADVVVVGSGAGGGTVAQRLGVLAGAGRRILVLEQGSRLDHRRFTGREIDMAEVLYRDGGAFMTDDGSVSLAFAEGYGGSTQVYTGSSLEPDARVIEQWGVPGLDYDDLIARLRRYGLDNHVALVPDERLNDNNRLFAEGCRKLGWRPRRFPINLDGCRGSSLCNLGCPNNAKQGTHVVQLPAAETHGVEVVCGARVERLVGSNSLDVVVDGQPGPMASVFDWPPGRYRVVAPVIVLAAGAVNTPALLLRSGLGSELPALGRWWTCQPAQILVASHDRPVTNSVGHPKSFLWDERIECERHFLEVCMYPPFITAKNMSGFGPDHAYFMERFNHLQMILVLACDKARPDHRVYLDRRGRTRVNYRLGKATCQALVDGSRAAAELFFAAGATDVHAPCSRPMRLRRAHRESLGRLIDARHFKTGTISVSAAHLMGGCRMGGGPDCAVTDAWGAVLGRRGWFIADASLFPAALETNPYQTVMALADRVADRIVDQVG